MRIKVLQMVYGTLIESDSWFQFVEKSTNSIVLFMATIML